MLVTDKFSLTDFSESEQTVVDYLMKQGESVRTMTTKEIAQATYTSPSTLIRIAHKMGFDGWVKLRDEWLDEKQYLDRVNLEVDASLPFQADSTDYEIARNLAELESSAIHDTLKLLNVTDLHNAVTMLRHAPIIYILTSTANRAGVEMFAYYMQRMHRSVEVMHDFSLGAFAATKEDCVLVISYSGELDHLKGAVKILKKRGIPYISVTSLGTNTIEQDAAVALRLSTREKLYSKIGNFSVNISITYLMDILFGCIFRGNYEKNLENRIHVARILEKDRRKSSLSSFEEE